MELEKAVKILKKEIEPTENRIAMELDIQAIETVLEALENSISTKKIEDKIQDVKEMKVDGEVAITARNFAIKELQELLEIGE